MRGCKFFFCFSPQLAWGLRVLGPQISTYRKKFKQKHVFPLRQNLDRMARKVRANFQGLIREKRVTSERLWGKRVLIARIFKLLGFSIDIDFQRSSTPGTYVLRSIEPKQSVLQIFVQTLFTDMPWSTRNRFVQKTKREIQMFFSYGQA